LNLLNAAAKMIMSHFETLEMHQQSESSMYLSMFLYCFKLGLPTLQAC